MSKSQKSGYKSLWVSLGATAVGFIALALTYVLQLPVVYAFSSASQADRANWLDLVLFWILPLAAYMAAAVSVEKRCVEARPQRVVAVHGATLALFAFIVSLTGGGLTAMGIIAAVIVSFLLPHGLSVRRITLKSIGVAAAIGVAGLIIIGLDFRIVAPAIDQAAAEEKARKLATSEAEDAAIEEALDAYDGPYAYFPVTGRDDLTFRTGGLRIESWVEGSGLVTRWRDASGGTLILITTGSPGLDGLCTNMQSDGTVAEEAPVNTGVRCARTVDSTFGPTYRVLGSKATGTHLTGFNDIAAVTENGLVRLVYIEASSDVIPSDQFMVDSLERVQLYPKGDYQERMRVLNGRANTWNPSATG